MNNINHLNEEEKEYILRWYDRWGRMKTLDKFDEITSLQLTKILKEAGRV